MLRTLELMDLFRDKDSFHPLKLERLEFFLIHEKISRVLFRQSTAVCLTIVVVGEKFHRANEISNFIQNESFKVLVYRNNSWVKKLILNLRSLWDKVFKNRPSKISFLQNIFKKLVIWEF